jgi:glutamate formiminotransferase
VAYNLWLTDPDLVLARRIAAAIRSDSIRALGLAVGNQVQVSMNLINPDAVGPAEAHEQVAAHAQIARAELVGLIPASVLQQSDQSQWEMLDLAQERTIEWRLAERERRLLWGGDVEGTQEDQTT